MTENQKEGSKILALALEKIDDLIAGQNLDEMELSSNRSQINSNDFNLELRLPENENSKVRRSHSLVDSWLGKSCFEKYKTNGNRNELSSGEMGFEDTIRSLKLEKENLLLQINVINDQIQAQNDKIKNLEEKLIVLNHKLNFRNSPQNEDCSKSLLDQVRKELLLEFSGIEHSDMGKEDKENIVKLENEVDQLKTNLLKKETEVGLLRLSLAKMARNTGYTLSESEMKLLRGKASSLELLTKCNQQDKLILDKPSVPPHSLSKTSQNYSTETNFSANSRYIFDNLKHKTTLLPEAKEKSILPLVRTNSSENVQLSKPQIFQNFSTMPRLRGPQVLQRVQEDIKQLQRTDYHKSLTNPSSLKLDNRQIKNVEANETKISHCAHEAFHSSQISSLENDKPNISFAQDDIAITSTQQYSIPDISNSILLGIGPNMYHQKNFKTKGLKKFFEKIKRNDSSTSSSKGNQFVKSNLRSSLGPRYDYHARQKIEVNLPFSKWDVDLIAHWFTIIGLEMYSTNCKQLIKNGDHLFNLTEFEIEKNLKIKNRLHRKKLKLALSCINNDSDQLTKLANKLDYFWVAKWLDDIGLPQYKEAFIEAKIDGSVLHHLTVEDLIDLNITSKLHYASIKRGIQVLRRENFNPICLKRRALPEETSKENWTPKLISLWTSHRTMEWLRSIDLSEYTPNLRGSGVHGALMIYEPLFDSDLLATLLSIPVTKTLLRRHLTTYFNKLIGKNLVDEKRDYNSKFTPLLPSTKFMINNGKFSLIRRRGKSHLNIHEYVCSVSENIKPEIFDECQKNNSDESYING